LCQAEKWEKKHRSLLGIPLCERNKKDSQVGSSVEKLDAALVKAVSWEQLSAAQWKGYGAEGDFCDST